MTAAGNAALWNTLHGMRAWRSRLGPWGRAIIAILALALLVRIAAMVAAFGHGLASDPADFARHASSLSRGDGYPDSLVTGGPTAIRPPGFPFLVAGVFAAGEGVRAVLLVQALLGTLIVGLIASIARELWGTRRGLVAGALAAVFPPLVVVGATLFSEPLFVALELTAILAVLRWRRRPRPMLLVLAGVAVGLAILTRTTGVLVLLPLALAVWRPREWRSARSHLAPALLIICAVLVVAPWTIRNAVVMDAFLPVSDQDGFTLVGTYNDTSRELGGVWIPGHRERGAMAYVEAHKGWSEPQLSAGLRDRARRFALDHPSYLLTVLKHNTLQLFSLSWEDEKTGQRVGAAFGTEWAALAAFGFYPFLGLALLGLAIGAWRGAPRWFSAIPILMLSVIMVVASSRFRAPIDPFLIIAAAGGVLWLADRIRASRAAVHSPP
jgi:4-amino-4-deoxy-L-arabinose transferase-like glycosyltransferase